MMPQSHIHPQPQQQQQQHQQQARETRVASSGSLNANQDQDPLPPPDQQVQALAHEQRRLASTPVGTSDTTSSLSATATAKKQTVITVIEFQDDKEPVTSTGTDSPTVNSSYWQLPPPSTPTSTATTATTNTPIDTSVVHLVLTEATLLSGDLDACFSAQDEDCEAGVAAVSAFMRHLIPPQQPSLVCPKFEKQSQFVQVHPLGWSVNRLILQGLLKWNLLLSTPSLLLQNKRDNYGSQRDLTYLQDNYFPFLLTNVDVPPSSSWATGYHQYVHFDPNTHIALLSIANSGEPLTYDQIHAAWGPLYTVADRNKANYCLPDPKNQALFQSYQDIYFQSPTSPLTSDTRCWIPVIVYDDGQPGNFQRFLHGIMQHPHPPALIIDVDDQASDLYPVPTLVQVPMDITPTATGTGTDVDLHATNNNSTTNHHLDYTYNATSNTFYKTVWVHSFGRDADMYYQHQLHPNPDEPTTLSNVTFTLSEMEVVPTEYKDDLYQYHIQYLRHQADQAIQNDPQVGYSTAFPVARDDGEYRRCQGGECEIGNLFTDAIRWKANAQVAFVTSGGLRGKGWPAGPVRISNIWASLPFPNGLCVGTMSGVSLFRMLDYSISIATFDSQDSNDGGRLLQVSGVEIIFNNQIPRGSSRIISIKVWDHGQKEWLPIERLRMYKFATDSYLCGAYDPYPDFLGANGNFTLDGEIPGVIGDELIQDIVAQYLQQLDGSYDAAIQGRIVNNTEVFDVLNMVQTQETCEAKSYWSERRGTCFPCPESSFVEFSDQRLEFTGQQSPRGIVPTDESKQSTIFNAASLNATNSTLMGKDLLQGRILLTNRELSNFSVVPKAIPSWLQFLDPESGSISDLLVVGGRATDLPSGAALALDFVVGGQNFEVGTALGTVSFGVLGRAIDGDEGIRSCDDYSRDATFDVFLSVTPPQELNNLGNLRFIGLTFMAIILITSLCFGGLIHKYSRTPILRTMQPMFLVTICIGIFIMALAILPMSLDDQQLSAEAADHKCMSVPWLLSMGMTVTFSALFSKLWRVNRLFNVRSFRRMKVTATDVMTPFAILFTLNAVLLSVWTALDPLQSDRLKVEGEPWKSYEACQTGDVGTALLYSVVAINIVALLLACHEAYKARHISDEFAESKAVGLAIVCWIQVLLVGFPALYLVDPDDITASYFLRVGLLFVICMSMMCIIFGPLIHAVFQYEKDPAAFRSRRASNFSGSVRVSISGFSQNSGLKSSHFEAPSRSSGLSHGHRPSAPSVDTSGSGGSPNPGVAVAVAAKRLEEAVASGELDMSSSSSSDKDDEESIQDLQRSIKDLQESIKWQDEELGVKAGGASTKNMSLRRPTEQMLLDDLVPRQAMDEFRENSFSRMQESDSSVPFGGSDRLLLDPLLTDDKSDDDDDDDDDSDSSVPFQRSLKTNIFADDDSSSGGGSSDSSSTIPTIAPQRNNYSQHLLHVTSIKSVPFHRHLALELAPASDVVPTGELKEADSASSSEGEGGELVNVEATAIVIATIENNKSTRMDELPFSSRFVGYKTRLVSSPTAESACRVVGDSDYCEKKESEDGFSTGEQLLRLKDDNRRKMEDWSDPIHLRSSGSGSMKNCSEPSHRIDARGRNGDEDYTRRRYGSDNENMLEEERFFVSLGEGKRPSDKDMLGYSLPDKWADEKDGGKNKKKKKKVTSLKSALSSLSQSFSALTPTGFGGANTDGVNVDTSVRGGKRKSQGSGLMSMSLPTLNFSAASLGRRNSNSDAGVLESSSDSDEHDEDDSDDDDDSSDRSLEVYENEPNSSSSELSLPTELK